MANEIRDAFNSVYADGPIGNPSQPAKSRIRQEIGGVIQAQFDDVDVDITGFEARATAAENKASSANSKAQLAIDTVNAGIKADKEAVRVLTTGGGGPTTFTAGASLEGVTLAAGDRVALAFGGQTGNHNNGIWVVQASGGAVRAPDMATSSDIIRSRFVVSFGSHAGEAWSVQNTSAITVGTTAIVIAMSTSANTTNTELIAARGGYANLTMGLDARARQAKTRAANLVWNGNLDDYGAGVTLFSDVLGNPASYPARPNYRIADPALNRLGCRFGIYVQANTIGLFGNQVRAPVRRFGGYLFCSVIVFNPTGDLWDFGTQTGPGVTIRYSDGTTDGVVLSSFIQIASGIRLYYAAMTVNASKLASFVDIGGFGSSSRGADYVLTGFWASWSRYSGLTLQETSFPDWSHCEARRPGLAALKSDLADPFTSVFAVLIGDSITWGAGASNMADPDPRTGALTDPRNNANSPSWANLLRGLLGSMGAGGQDMDVSTINTDGVATYRQGSLIDVARDPRVTYWNGSDPLQKLPAVSTAARAGAYLGLNQGGNCFLEFTIIGDSFDVLYGTQTSVSAVFDVEVDGAVVKSQNTLDSSATFTKSVAVSVTFGLHRVRIINKSTTIAVNIDGVVHNRLIKVVNQGINGSSTPGWMPAQALLAPAVDGAATHLIVTLGTNDRGAANGRDTAFRDRLRTILRNMHGQRPLLTVTLAVANKARGNKELFYDYSPNPNPYAFDMSTVSRVIHRVAGEFGLDVIDHYAETDAIETQAQAFTATRASGSNTLTAVSSLAGMVLGAPIRGLGLQPNTTVRYVSGPSTVELSKPALSSGAIADGIVGLYTDDDLHPNDYGYRVMFDNIRRRLLAAPMIGPM